VRAREAVTGPDGRTAGQTSPLKLDPLLIQLAIDGLSEDQITAEGFTIWEVRAARAIVGRAYAQAEAGRPA